MSLATVVLLSCANVASRSSLNVIDRFVFGKSKIGFFRLYFFVNALPLLIGILILAFAETKMNLWAYFLTLPCFLLAISTHLVGMSFSYAFRHCEVRQVVIKAKMPELLFAFASFIPFITETLPRYSLGLKNYCTLIATLIGVIFLFFERKSRIFSLFDRTGVYIIGSLVIQMVCSSLMSISAKTLGEIILLSVAMLLWRCCLMLPVLCLNSLFSSFKNDQTMVEPVDVEQSSRNQISKILGILSFRAILALLTQLTFTWCILEGSPLLIWPIFNTTPLVSSVASQFILKENPHWAEIIALLCLFSGATCTVFL